MASFKLRLVPPLAAIGFFASCATTEDLDENQVDTSNMVVVHGVAETAEIRHDVMPMALRDLPPAARFPLVVHEVKPIPRPGRPVSEREEQAPLISQLSVAQPLAPTNLANFNGIGNGIAGFTVNSAPPDTDGDVGPNHYVQIVNSDIAVYNKTTGALLLGPEPTNTLWSGFGGLCQTDNDGDGTVLYDPIADRWVIAQFAVSGTSTAFLHCIAVSTSPDPTGTWFRFSFNYGNQFPDYPKMGVWPDAYYQTFNMFNAAGTSFLGGKVCAYDRTKMLAGQTPTQVCFTPNDAGALVGGLLPADLDGARQPPAGTPNYVLALGNNANQLAFYKFHVDFTTPTNSTLTGPVDLGVTAFTEACGGGTCVPQTGTTQRLDSLADRLMYRLAYRNFADHDALVVSHAISTTTSTTAPTAIRWYELRNMSTTPAVFQSGTFVAPGTSTFAWMSSAAMDQAGNIGLGYSTSSSTTHPGIHYTGRLATDAAGAMTQGDNVLITGAGSQLTNLSRWGDYAQMSVDPADDCTFFFTSEFIPANGTFNWRTQVGSFKLPGCGGVVTNDFSIGASPTSVSSVQGGAAATSTISTAVTSGSAESVAFSISGLPAGATATFNPTSVTAGGSSTLSLAAAATTPTGTFSLTITGTAASATHATSVSWTVTAPVTNDFSIAANPTSVSSTQGGAAATSTISTAVTAGAAQSVALSVTGLPASATATFNPTSVTAGGSSTLSLSAAAGTPTGTFSLTVTGTGASATHSTTVSWTVTAAGGTELIVNGGFEGSSAPWTLSGNAVRSTGSFPHSGTGYSILGITNSSSGAEFQTITIPAGTAPQLTFWLNITTQETTRTTQFDKLFVEIRNTSGTLLATLATFSNLNSGTAGAYVLRGPFNLSQFAGQTIRVQFRNTNDISLPTNFRVDDVSVK